MKFLHVADLHLESRMETHLDREQARERQIEIVQDFARVVEEGIQRGAQAVLIAGDIFDKKNILKRTIREFLHVLEQYPTVNFYCLRGNHDENVVLTEAEGEHANLITFGPQWKQVPLDAEGRVMLTAAELTDQSEGLFEALVLRPEKINVVMLHGQDTPGRTEKNVGIIPMKALAGRSIDYLALGHIHTFREGQLDARGIYVYPGCLCSRGFDEAGEHGAVLVTVDETTGTVSYERYRRESRACRVLEVDVTGCETSLDAESRMDEALQGIPTTDLVKVELVGQVSVDSLIEMAYLEKAFDHRFYCMKIKNKTEVYVDCHNYENELSLKGEFVREVQKDDRLSEAEKAELIRIGLRALRGEEF